MLQFQLDKFQKNLKVNHKSVHFVGEDNTFHQLISPEEVAIMNFGRQFGVKSIFIGGILTSKWSNEVHEKSSSFLRILIRMMNFSHWNFEKKKLIWRGWRFKLREWPILMKLSISEALENDKAFMYLLVRNSKGEIFRQSIPF